MTSNENRKKYEAKLGPEHKKVDRLLTKFTQDIKELGASPYGLIVVGDLSSMFVKRGENAETSMLEALLKCAFTFDEVWGKYDGEYGTAPREIKLAVAKTFTELSSRLIKSIDDDCDEEEDEDEDEDEPTVVLKKWNGKKWVELDPDEDGAFKV